MGRSRLLLNKVMQMSVATIEESTLYALVPFTQYAFVSQVLFSHHIHALCLFGIRMCRQAFEAHLSSKITILKHTQNYLYICLAMGSISISVKIKNCAKSKKG